MIFSKQNILIENKIQQVFQIILIQILICSSPAFSQENSIAIVPQNKLRDVVHELIETANKEILIAQFILSNDESGQAVINHLIHKANQVVTVKLLIDGIGAYSYLPLTKNDLQEIAGQNIALKRFHPKWRKWFRIKKRMHDKILISDDQALIGSSSFWDVSLDTLQIETDVLVRGPIVEQIRDHFLVLWESKSAVTVIGKMPKFPKYVYHSKFRKKIINEIVFFKTDSIEYWNDGCKKRKYAGSFSKTIAILSNAQNEIIIVNPYFLPNSRLKKAIQKVIARGVRVSIYTNSSDQLSLEYKMLGVAYSKNDVFYQKNNLIVYESPEDFGMIHSKMILIDGKFLYIGSQNLDPLGMNHNTENGILFVSEDIIKWFHREILFYEENFNLAFYNGKPLRVRYTIKNKIKLIWRKSLVFCLKGVL